MKDFAKDEVYEEMDWLTQAIQPVISSLSQDLEKIPEKIDVTQHTIKKLGSWDSVYMRELIHTCYAKHFSKTLSYEEERTLCKHFSLSIEIESGDELIFDRATDTTTNGKIYLIKNSSMIEEQDLKKMLGASGMNDFRRNMPTRMSLPRYRECLRIFGIQGNDERYKTTSQKFARRHISSIMSNFFQENPWNIKSVELSNKIPMWIFDYLVKANSASLINLTRLKAVASMNDGGPIYSFKEV